MSFYCLVAKQYDRVGDGIGSERMIVALTFRFALNVWFWLCIFCCCCYEHWSDFICSVNNRIVGRKRDFFFRCSVLCALAQFVMQMIRLLFSLVVGFEQFFSLKEVNHSICICDEYQLLIFNFQVKKLLRSNFK